MSMEDISPQQKHSATCANYAQRHVAKDNAEDSLQTAKLINRMLDNFVKRVPLTRTARETYKAIQRMRAK